MGSMMKKMMIYFLMSGCIVNIAMAGIDNDIELRMANYTKREEEAIEAYSSVRNRDAANALGVLAAGWTTIGLGGFGAYLKLKKSAKKEARYSVFAQASPENVGKIMRKARIARAFGYLGLTPLASFVTGQSIYKVASECDSDAVEKVGTVAMMPALFMVFKPAAYYADKNNEVEYEICQARVAKLRKEKLQELSSIEKIESE
jgi:hypothetical protein